MPSCWINRAMDCTYRQSGPLVWYMRRYKPGDRCWAWCFWNMKWYRARITGQSKDIQGYFYLENLDIVNNDGTFCSDSAYDYRMRPRWFFWARRLLVLASICALWQWYSN